jgi:hypothetical protein
MNVETRSLIQTRYTIPVLALAAICLVVAIGALAWVFLTPQPTLAGTCGSIYLTSFTCHNNYTAIPGATCPDGSQLYNVQHWNMSKWANPYSNRIDGNGGVNQECHPTLNCPSKCN